MKNESKTQDASSWHFKDQNLNSISALYPKKIEEDSLDNATIG